jgi:hypothetical protein
LRCHPAARVRLFRECPVPMLVNISSGALPAGVEAPLAAQPLAVEEVCAASPTAAACGQAARLLRDRDPLRCRSLRRRARRPRSPGPSPYRWRGPYPRACRGDVRQTVSLTPHGRLDHLGHCSAACSRRRSARHLGRHGRACIGRVRCRELLANPHRPARTLSPRDGLADRGFQQLRGSVSDPQSGEPSAPGGRVPVASLIARISSTQTRRRTSTR